MPDQPISPRTGRPLQKQLAKSKQAMELRAKKIVTAILDGATQEQALLSAGYSAQTAKTQSTAILENPIIQKTFCEILEKAGLTETYVAKKHRELLDATRKQDGVDVPDYMAMARGLDFYYKITNRYVDKKEISGRDGGPIKVESLTDDELLAIIHRGRGEGTVEN